MDPFEALGSISGGPPLAEVRAPPPPQQQQSAPRPSWPGMNNPSTSTAAFAQQPQYPSPVGNSSRFAGNSSSVGFHQNIMGRANLTLHPQQQQSPPGASAGYTMYPAGPHQLQYQQQQVAATAPATPWSTGTAAASPSGGFTPTGAWKPGVAPYVQHSPGLTAAAAATAATPEPAQRSSMSAEGWGGGGAEWTPPADQMVSYHAMWTTASAGCPVPGTVSGRAAVQFFSRSGLPKDALKTIWSLCDPSLTGRICQPGFFAAMRLIVICQQGPPSSPPLPTVSALEAMRFTQLPLPRMEGFPPPSLPAGAGGGGGSGIEGFPSGPVAAAGPAAGGMSAPHAAASATLPSLDGFPAISVVGGGGGEGRGGAGGAATMGGAVAGNARGGVEFPSPLLSAAGPTGSPPRTESTQPQPYFVGMATATPPPPAGAAAIAAVGVEPATANGEEEDDDFGDFAGAQEEEEQPPAPPTDGDEGDDFGDFAGAPTSVGEQALATPALAVVPTSGGGGGDEIAWMMGGGDKAAASSGRNEADAENGGGLDDLIKSNLYATTAGPVHLADMQSTPPLLGKAPDPVMVDRAAVARSKLSVFDEMADLDLAVGQEDWNDFADETTAPPRSPTPPPPPPPSSPPPAAAAASAEGAGDAVAGVATAMATGGSDGASETHEAPQPPAPPREPGLGNDDGGGGGGSGGPLTMAMGDQQEPLPFSPFGDVEVIPAASETEASDQAPAPPAEALAESQDDDWGDFEDASGRKESSDGATAAGGQDGGTATSGAADDGDEEWGTFTDAPATAAAAMEGGIDSSEAGAEAGAGDSADSPEVPQTAVDPFAEIAPPTPPGPSLAYGDGEVASPGGNEETTTVEQERSASVEGVGLGGSRGASVTGAGLPLSLRGLRDALARQGRLEEAVEVQQRMELPSTPSVSPPAHDNAAGDGSIHAPVEGPGSLGADAAEADSGGGQEDRDLERWRAVVELPPAPTVDELAKTMAAADPARATKFRARFVDGRPPVEEEALTAGGGAAALAAAVRRQRAARRAVYLSSVLSAESDSVAATAGDVFADKGGAADGLDGGAGKQGGEAELELELEVGFGLDVKGARPPSTLSDWALMTAYVTRAAEEGLAALEDGGGGGGGGDDVTGGEEGTPRPASPTPAPPPPPPPPFSPTLGPGDAASSPETGATRGAGAVSGEVARSEKFEAFARGLREAVKVCRMTQAAAEDACLDGVAGFGSMEKAWAELRRSAREASDSDEVCSVFGGEEEEEEEEEEEKQDDRQRVEGAGTEPTSTSPVFGPFSSGSGGEMAAGMGGGRGSRSSGGFACSVEAVREACIGHPHAGSALCAVSLQPLAVFGGGGGGSAVGKSSPAPGVVEYCAVRYLACAVNLWVNVLDKPPPGPLP